MIYSYSQCHVRRGGGAPSPHSGKSEFDSDPRSFCKKLTCSPYVGEHRLTFYPLSVNGYLFLSVDHMINWQREQGVILTSLSPQHSLYWPQYHCNRECKYNTGTNWMDRLMKH